MSSRLVADFLATIHTPPLAQPQTGRVLMRRDHIVCVSEDVRVDIPLAKVFDVGVGSVPPALSKYFDDSLSIAYEEDDSRKTIVLEARAEPMGTFRTILFKCLLTGEPVMIRHPAKRGGRVIDTGYEPGTLGIDRDELIVRRAQDAVSIDLDTITAYTKGQGRIDGESHRLIEVGFTDDGTVVTARLAPAQGRILALLGRYLRIQYSRLHREVVGMELEETALQVLVALDAGATELEGMIPGVDDVDTLIDELHKHRLVASNGDGLVLTRRGRIATNTHMESVN